DPRTKQPAADLVRGKGVGIVVLLQGPPGVGKTYTAEAIAEYTRRALYPITPADLGSDLSRIDKNLNTILNRGRKWGCILLLDEADVYFMPRGADDLQRNCIVSSFLRQIEYYTGIVFLTTNRTVGLDEAIVSRVTIPLVYQPLNRIATGRLWETYCNNVKRFIPPLRSKKPLYINVSSKARDWWGGQYNEAIRQRRPWWSGRQIQMAFRRAIELA
ncbi:P-loop containing nucleoside triphosphate hydrolase protein, partial [Glonium stellatum]